jgi:membrane protease subunit HflK
MITGDENIVLADMVVQWRISDPGKFLFASSDPEEVLRNATSTALRSTIGSSKIDDALTTGKAAIEGKIRESLVATITKYDLGITIVATQLQDVSLPTQEVQDAFTGVTTAREQMNTTINKANQYRNKAINEAKGEKDAMISNAEGDKATRLGQAKGDVAVFNKLYAEYKTMPDVTSDRLTLEAMDLILGKAKVYITDGSGSTVQYLPLDQVRSKDTKDSSSASSAETKQ